MFGRQQKSEKVMRFSNGNVYRVKKKTVKKILRNIEGKP